MGEAEEGEEEKMGLETGREVKGGEMRDLLRETKGNLETDGTIGARRSEKRSERREGERGKAGGGRRLCLLTCKQHWLPIRRRRRREKQISSRSLKEEEPRRAGRNKIEACRSRMKSPLISRRMNRHSLLLVSRCRRIQVELVCRNSRGRLQAAEKGMLVNGRRVLARRTWRQQAKLNKGIQIGIRALLAKTLENRQNRTHCRMTAWDKKSRDRGTMMHKKITMSQTTEGRRWMTRVWRGRSRSL